MLPLPLLKNWRESALATKSTGRQPMQFASYVPGAFRVVHNSGVSASDVAEPSVDVLLRVHMKCLDANRRIDDALAV